MSILDFVLMLQAARAILLREGTAEIGLSDRGDEWLFSEDGESVRLRTRGALGKRWMNGACPAESIHQLVDDPRWRPDPR
ncbi:hypothetical protein Ahu01nite_077830 [Winogradskya humida]|uniref:Uncharacterized protein n=1 Tax=Winogradskya humida TaxID=113566 RepID=A0ABQ4A1E6_9ACTN|nr:hypothetical protein Ahu01nite_077830 [Actinoplanes humidus]